MIDIKTELESIEKLMKLMDKYKIDEVSIDYLNLKKSRFNPDEITDKQIIQEHTKPDIERSVKVLAGKRVEDIENFFEGK